jgi:hypothetical protein
MPFPLRPDYSGHASSRPATSLIRACAASCIATARGKLNDPQKVAAEAWPRDHGVPLMLKAASLPATTSRAADFVLGAVPDFCTTGVPPRLGQFCTDEIPAAFSFIEGRFHCSDDKNHHQNTTWPGGHEKNISRPKCRPRRRSKNAKCPLFLKIAPAARRTGHAVPAIFQTREFAAARPCSM